MTSGSGGGLRVLRTRKMERMKKAQRIYRRIMNLGAVHDGPLGNAAPGARDHSSFGLLKIMDAGRRLAPFRSWIIVVWRLF